jgi:transposase-like protein
MSVAFHKIPEYTSLSEFEGGVPMFPTIKCPNPECPGTKPINRRGAFFRQRDKRHVTQYFCSSCGKAFSEATFEVTYRQQKPDINAELRTLLMSGVSGRRAAILLGVDRKTVARRIPFLAMVAEKAHRIRIPRADKRTFVHTDEMETFEHTKCKPVSIPLVVDAWTREILDIDVAVMPAKGRLAKIAKAKYGFRRDDRVPVMTRMMERLNALVAKDAVVRSDMCPRYGPIISKALPQVRHQTVRARRGCVVGYGELKATGKDPLFNLNHTAAMVRDNVKRMSRRTWCTTKRIDRLRDMLWIYVDYHNTVLIPLEALNASDLVAA